MQNPDGSFAAPDSALDLARVAVGVEYARDTISSATEVSITDEDGDGFQTRRNKWRRSSAMP